MKIKDGFILQTIAGSNVVIPTGERAADLNGMITLNDTAVFLWKHLMQPTDVDTLVNAVLDSYEVDRERAMRCVVDFVNQLEEVGCLE